VVKKNNNIELKKKYAILTIKWCREFFGVNERKKTKLEFEFTTRKRSIKKAMVYGNYCFYRNKMTIHEPACETLYDVVSTVIHEYTHYLQSRTLYKKYQDKYYYSRNPYEREAKRNEEKYTKECMKYIKSFL
jgi:Zn-dependent peptidase ImmA (M78 family)